MKTYEAMSNFQFDQKIYKKLTDREMEIARLAKDGKSCKDSAESLGIAISTVGSIRSSILQKIGCKNITEAVVSLIQAGIL